MATRDRTSQSTGLRKDRTSQSTGTKNKQPTTTAAPVYNGGGGGGGSSYRKSGGGGGGGGGASAKDTQNKTQAQLDNTGGNYNKRAGDLAKNTQDRVNDISGIAKDRLGDMDKNAQAQLNNINQSMKANNASLKENRRNIMQNVQWQPNQQKEQSTLMALRNRMGNAAYGSGIQDLAEGLQRVDDMNDVELINAWKQNENSAYSNWYQANEALVSDYNDQIASINEQFSQFDSDYRDQMSKLKADYNDEMSKLYSQYWSTMSNINPELATEKNLKTAAERAGKVSSAVTKAENIQKVVNSMVKNITGKKAKKVKVAGTADQQAAAKIINKAVKDKSNKGNATKVKNAATKAAKAAVEDAKNANRVSVGKKTDKYYLPNVNLARTVNFNSTLPSRSSTLQNLMKTKASASATNPRTSAYVRPNAARGDVLLGGANGTINNSRAANTGFSDNLAALRRV